MANFLSITRKPLDVAAITNSIFREDCGAVSIFVGTARNSFDGKMVHSLKYEAYETMALKELEKICDAGRSHWNDVVNKGSKRSYCYIVSPSRRRIKDSFIFY